MILYRDTRAIREDFRDFQNESKWWECAHLYITLSQTALNASGESTKLPLKLASSSPAGFPITLSKMFVWISLFRFPSYFKEIVGMLFALIASAGTLKPQFHPQLLLRSQTSFWLILCCVPALHE